MQIEEKFQNELRKNPLLTIKQACDYLNINKRQAQILMNKYSNLTTSEKLQLRNKLNFTHPKLEISEQAHQIIIGSLLGDGCITLKRHGMFTILHSNIQREYVEYKKYLLDNYGIKCYLRYNKGTISYIDGRAIKNNGQLKIESKVNIVFDYYRNEWYKPNKCIPKMVYDLNALGLAIWFMDDGTKNKSSYYLSTQCFSYEDHLILQDVLLKNFNIHTSIHKQKNTFVLYIKSRDRETFTNIILPFICDSMKYKIFNKKS